MSSQVRRTIAGAVGLAAVAVLLPVVSLPASSALAPSAAPVSAAPVSAASMSAASVSAARRTVTPVVQQWRAAAPARVLMGSSVRGHPIVARRQGPSTAPYVVLLLGQMHGSEPGGRAVVRALRRLAPPAQLQVWSIDTINPDGARLGTRRNARKVDLNRNFPHHWRRGYTQRLYFPGPRAASEPETRAFMAFVDALRPDLIVSLHQAFRSVDAGIPRARTWARRLATAFDLPMTVVPCRGPCAGTLIGWYNQNFAGYAVTVELTATVPAARARRYARATLRAARLLVLDQPPVPTPTPTPTP